MNVEISLVYPKALKSLDTVASDAMKIAVEDMRRVLKRRILSGTPIDTGRLRSGWEITSTPYGFDVINNVPYAGYVEMGAGWPSPGPRTVASNGRVWSRQAVGGILAPIVQDPNWIDGAVNLIVEYMRRKLKS